MRRTLWLLGMLGVAACSTSKAPTPTPPQEEATAEQNPASAQDCGKPLGIPEGTVALRLQHSGMCFTGGNFEKYTLDLQARSLKRVLGSSCEGGPPARETVVQPDAATFDALVESVGTMPLQHADAYGGDGPWDWLTVIAADGSESERSPSSGATCGGTTWGLDRDAYSRVWGSIVRYFETVDFPNGRVPTEGSAVRLRFRTHGATCADDVDVTLTLDGSKATLRGVAACTGNVIENTTAAIQTDAASPFNTQYALKQLGFDAAPLVCNDRNDEISVAFGTSDSAPTYYVTRPGPCADNERAVRRADFDALWAATGLPKAAVVPFPDGTKAFSMYDRSTTRCAPDGETFYSVGLDQYRQLSRMTRNPCTQEMVNEGVFLTREQLDPLVALAKRLPLVEPASCNAATDRNFSAGTDYYASVRGECPTEHPFIDGPAFETLWKAMGTAFEAGKGEQPSP